jgi:hypothetical protein
MKNRNQWTDYLVELLVVFVSITAAFLLNNWREDTVNRGLEKKYLTSIYQDLVADSLSMSHLISIHEKKLDEIQGYVKQLRGKQEIGDSASALFGSMLSNYSIQPNSTTYESMKNSGDLKLIRDYRIRDAIVKYYEIFPQIRLQEQVGMNFVYDYVVRFAFEAFDLLHQQLYDEKSIAPYRLNNIILGYHLFVRQNLENQKAIFNADVGLLKMLEPYRPAPSGEPSETEE